MANNRWWRTDASSDPRLEEATDKDCPISGATSQPLKGADTAKTNSRHCPRETNNLTKLFGGQPFFNYFQMRKGYRGGMGTLWPTTMKEGNEDEDEFGNRNRDEDRK